jgi:hypothetical protein
MQWESKDAVREIEQEATDLVQQYHTGTALNAAGDRKMRSPQELENAIGLLIGRKVQRERYNV